LGYLQAAIGKLKDLIAVVKNLIAVTAKLSRLEDWDTFPNKVQTACAKSFK
jgi:hypothetical protein